MCCSPELPISTAGDNLVSQSRGRSSVGRAPGWQPGGPRVRIPPAPRATGFTFAGFVAGEGCFCISTTARRHVDGYPIQKFIFLVTVEARDLGMLEQLRAFLGFGSIRHVERAKPQWQPQVVYTVNSLTAHWQATIPFADRYLLPSAKRDQFEAWREDLERYVERYNIRCGRGPSPCSIEGCEKLVRGRGLCRSHYYRATGW